MATVTFVVLGAGWRQPVRVQVPAAVKRRIERGVSMARAAHTKRATVKKGLCGVTGCRRKHSPTGHHYREA